MKYSSPETDPRKLVPYVSTKLHVVWISEQSASSLIGDYFYWRQKTGGEYAVHYRITPNVVAWVADRVAKVRDLAGRGDAGAAAWLDDAAMQNGWAEAAEWAAERYGAAALAAGVVRLPVVGVKAEAIPA